jgi:hypothetical protein
MPALPVRLRSCRMMLWHNSTHSGQIKTLLGPSIKVSAWLADLPQKLQTALGFLVLVFFAIVEFPLSNQFSPSKASFQKSRHKRPAAGAMIITVYTSGIKGQFENICEVGHDLQNVRSYLALSCVN